MTITTVGCGDSSRSFFADTFRSCGTQPEDIGLVTDFVGLDDSRWITGEIIYASGGFR